MSGVVNKTMRWHWDGKDYILEVPIALSDQVFFAAVEKAFNLHQDRLRGMPAGDKRDEGVRILNLMEAWLCREFAYKANFGKISRDYLTRGMLTQPDMKAMGEILTGHNIVQRLSNTSDGIGKKADVILFKATERETSKVFTFGRG